MPSLLVVVFLVEAAVHLINVVGAASINNLLWTIINLFPVPTAKAAAQQRKLQPEYLKVRRELNATSSQDEFAKWAKLRRQHDKLLEQLDAAKKSQDGARAKFDSYLTVIRLLLTRAPQYILPFWYAKEPMFWLPHGWFPYYAEWIISFPRAPLGSVSIASWQLACTGVIALFGELVTGILGLVWSGRRQREAPMSGRTSSSSGQASQEKPQRTEQDKKEL